MLERLASVEPITLACMHGSAWHGDGASCCGLWLKHCLDSRVRLSHLRWRTIRVRSLRCSPWLACRTHLSWSSDADGTYYQV